MSQSTFGKKFTVTTWGESHGKALGAVVDGVPAGLFLTEADIQVYLDRRKPGSLTVFSPPTPLKAFTGFIFLSKFNFIFTRCTMLWYN